LEEDDKIAKEIIKNEKEVPLSEAMKKKESPPILKEDSITE